MEKGRRRKAITKRFAFQANAETSVLDVSESEQQQRLFLQKLKEIRVKSLPVALSLFKDYPAPFVFTKPVPSHPKIPNCLREFYKPSISRDLILENIKKSWISS